METIQGTVIIDNSIKNSKNEAMIEQLSTVSEDFYQVDDVTIAPDSSVVDCTQDMETDESVKSLLDQEQDSTNLFEQEGQGTLSTESISAEKDETAFHQNNTNLVKDNGILHQDNGVLHQDNGVLHQDNGVLHQDNGVLHQDNGVLHQDNGVLHQDNGVLHQDNGVPLNENSVLHQDKINLQDKVSIVNDTVLIHDTGLTQEDEYGRNLILGHQDLGSINQTNLLSREKRGGMQISQDSGTVTTDCPKQQQECSGCKKSIIDRFLLKAMDQYWHEDCLKCSCCDCRLGEVGSTLFAKANLLLCRRDYLRLFGTTGYCSACSKMIPAFEMVMRAKNNVYHLECFACQMCNHRFCVGDKFYLCDNKILCEYDYEERMVFANMTYNYNALSQIKRQTNSLSDDLSSGYGSPSPGSL